MRKPTPVIILLSLSFTVTSLTGCWSFYKDPNGDFVALEAFVPVYGVDTAYRTITTLAPQPTILAGKIYVLGSTLFQVENLKGVHVINYSDKANPVKVSFIRSGGATEVAVKNGYLIVNNAEDLVTIDIGDINNVKEVARVKNAFRAFHTEQYLLMKPPAKGYFVCPLPPFGQDVVGWKLEKNVPNPTCYN